MGLCLLDLERLLCLLSAVERSRNLRFLCGRFLTVRCYHFLYRGEFGNVDELNVGLLIFILR